MSLIEVKRDLCAKDGLCVAVCPYRTLVMGPDGFPESIPDGGCISCGHCVAVCAREALSHSRLPDDPLLPVAPLPSAEAVDGLLMGRRSVRAYKDQAVSKETISALLDIARRAPTAKNAQQLHWIVVSGTEKIRALSAETIAWLNEVSKANMTLGADDPILRGAPTVVVACTPADYAWGKADASIALSYMEIAAAARGLGTCWAGFLSRGATAHAPLTKLLAVPDGYTVQGALMIGYGKYRYKFIPARKPLSVQWQ